MSLLQVASPIHFLPSEIWNLLGYYVSGNEYKALRETCTYFAHPDFMRCPSKDGWINARVAMAILNILKEKAVGSISKKLTEATRMSVRYIDLSGLEYLNKHGVNEKNIAGLIKQFPNARGINVNNLDMNEKFIHRILRSMKQLTVLEIANNKITTATLKNIPDCIEGLNFSFCNLKEADNVEFKRFVKLKKMNISGAEIEKTLLVNLSGSIEELYLGQCNLIDRDITSLSPLRNLKVLDISGNHKVRGSTFNTLPTSLESFYCSGRMLTYDAVVSLQLLTSLRVLEIFENRVPALPLSILSPDMEELYLCRGGLDDNDISQIGQFKNLRVLVIAYNYKVTGKTFDKLSASIQKLYCGCCSLNDAAITRLQHLTQLHTLSLREDKDYDNVGNNTITGKTFKDLPSSVQKLNCYRCNITKKVYKEFEELMYLSYSSDEESSVANDDMSDIDYSTGDDLSSMSMDYSYDSYED